MECETGLTDLLTDWLTLFADWLTDCLTYRLTDWLTLICSNLVSRRDKKNFILNLSEVFATVFNWANVTTVISILSYSPGCATVVVATLTECTPILKFGSLSMPPGKESSLVSYIAHILKYLSTYQSASPKVNCSTLSVRCNVILFHLWLHKYPEAVCGKFSFPWTKNKLY